MRERLVELYVKEETRQKIRELKTTLTYDEFLNALLQKVNQNKKQVRKNKNG